MDPTALALALVLGVSPLPRVGHIHFYTPESGEGFPSAYPRALLMSDDALWVALGATGTPEGLARIARASLDAAKLELVRFPEVDEVRGLARDRDGSVVIASSRGLFRSRGAVALTPIAVPASETVRGLEAAPDGGLWVAIGRDGGPPEGGVTAAPLDALDTLAKRARCFRTVALLPRAADEALLVCEDSIIHAGPRAAFALDLSGTPLRSEGHGEGYPVVWIHEAIRSTLGDVFVLAHTGGLIRVGERIERVADDGRARRIAAERAHQEVLPMRDFNSIAADASGGVLIGDASGVLQRWTSTGVERLWPYAQPPAGAIGERAEVEPIAAEGDWSFVHTGGVGGGSIVRLGRDGSMVVWRLQRPGTSYSDPGVLDVLPDGKGGLWVSTNDGLWHLEP